MSAPILEIRDISVAFGGVQALNGVSMSINPGELRVLIGANGAGKSTLLDIVCGKTRANSGQIVLRGTDITNASEMQRTRAGIMRKFQTPTAFDSLTVRENLALVGGQRYGLLRNVFTRVGNWQRERIDTMVETLGLASVANRAAGELAHGQKQWLALGVALMHEPEVVLLDEPTAGMTQSETAATTEVISRFQGDHTLIVVEHDMAFVRSICEKITVLHQGEVLAEGTADEIENDERVREAYLGSAGMSHV